MRQIEKTDGAAIGALVNTQAELHFSNLLSAVRSGKYKSMDVKVSDDLGQVVERVRKGESISEQISKAFVQDAKAVLTEIVTDEQAQEAYDNATSGARSASQGSSRRAHSSGWVK